MSQIIFQVQSILIVILMLYGVSLVIGSNKNRWKHSRIMKAVIIWDILLILQIELTRGAIAKASKAMDNHMMLNIHVSLAISTVLLYVFAAYFGNKVLNGDETYLKKHKLFGRITVILRLLTLITSFFVIR